MSHKISVKQKIFWKLLMNYRKNHNEYLGAGAFCEKEVDMRRLGRQWIPYKGATRISDTVYADLKKSVCERQERRAVDGTTFFVYRLKPHFKMADLPDDYLRIARSFKLFEMDNLI